MRAARRNTRPALRALDQKPNSFFTSPQRSMLLLLWGVGGIGIGGALLDELLELEELLELDELLELLEEGLADEGLLSDGLELLLLLEGLLSDGRLDCDELLGWPARMLSLDIDDAELLLLEEDEEERLRRSARVPRWLAVWPGRLSAVI